MNRDLVGKLQEFRVEALEGPGDIVLAGDVEGGL